LVVKPSLAKVILLCQDSNTFTQIILYYVTRVTAEELQLSPHRGNR